MKDWYNDDAAGAATDPVAGKGGFERVLRGGSWGSAPHDLRSARRGYLHPGNRCFGLGFRLARRL